MSRFHWRVNGEKKLRKVWNCDDAQEFAFFGIFKIYSLVLFRKTLSLTFEDLLEDLEPKGQNLNNLLIREGLKRPDIS